MSGKRLIGRRVGELQRVTDELRKTTIIHMTENGEVAVDVSGRTYTVVHITAMFLRHLKCMAEEYLKQPITSAVVSVPAYFYPTTKSSN